ncbi:unnamed protein product [Amoebophrya sp. A25]|nr:unnamed protein product [Amoebophrya sp. A25]|eukprot:GSA25T00006552001.1
MAPVATTSTAPSVATSSAYDLTPKLAPFLDAHLLLMIMQSLKSEQIYPEETITAEMVRVVRDRTELISFLQDLDPQNDHTDRLRASADRVVEEKKEIHPLLRHLEHLETVKEAGAEPTSGESTDSSSGILNCQSFKELENMGVNRNHLELYYKWCVSLWKAGIYDKSLENLNHYQTLMTKIMVKDLEMSEQMGAELAEEKKKLNQRILSVKWGLLAGYLVKQENYPEAAQQILSIDEFLEEATTMTKKEVLVQRTWLQHWMLFVLFKSGDLESTSINSAITRVVELFLSEKYLALMSLMCPYLLRYAGGLFLMNKKLKGMLKDLVHVLAQDRESYSDPLTDFLLALHQDMDFDRAKEALEATQKLCASDYFLKNNLESILSNARLSIFSIYCRIHESVDIGVIAEKMGLDPPRAEAWIVSLIQQGSLSNACIDSDGKGNSSVFFPKEESDVYTQVVEKTNNVAFRLYLLQVNADGIANKTGSKKVTKLAGEIAAQLS